MARFCFWAQFLLLSSSSWSFLLASNSSPTKVPQRQGAAGVFMLIDGGRYTFNFTAARDACLFRNVTLATRAQMERAVRHGLETCKFGWTAEQIAVVPRLTADPNCGKGKTGVVTWFASTDREFGAFCFDASDVEEPPNQSTASPRSSSSSSTALKAATRTSAPLTASTTGPQPPRTPRTPKAPERTSLPSAVTRPFQTRSARIPVTSSTPETLPTHGSTPLPRLVPSKPTGVALTFSSSPRASEFSVSSDSTVPKLARPARPSPGDVPTALIVLGIVLLLLSAAGGFVWFCKPRNISTFWNQGQQTDDIETEMWKHTDSEVDLHGQHHGEEEGEGEEEEEDELDMKYSSDMTLCVNSDIKANSE